MPDTTYSTINNRLKRLVDLGDETYAEVTSLPAFQPAIWNPTTAFYARVYTDVEIQLIGTPTTAYIFQDSLDGVNFNDCNLWDKNGTMLAAVSVPGRYRLPGSCFLRARQGAGSTITIRAGN